MLIRDLVRLRSGRERSFCLPSLKVGDTIENAPPNLYVWRATAILPLSLRRAFADVVTACSLLLSEERFRIVCGVLVHSSSTEFALVSGRIWDMRSWLIRGHDNVAYRYSVTISDRACSNPCCRFQ